MRPKPPETDEYLEKQAQQFDQMVERAEVRRARASDLGVQREVDGALRTIESAKESARRLRDRMAGTQKESGS